MDNDESNTYGLALLSLKKNWKEYLSSLPGGELHRRDRVQQEMSMHNIPQYWWL